MSEYTLMDHWHMIHSNMTEWESYLSDAILMGDWLRVGKVRDSIRARHVILNKVEDEIDVSVLDQYDSDIEVLE